jgi:CHAT domain-containing protein
MQRVLAVGALALLAACACAAAPPDRQAQGKGAETVRLLRAAVERWEVARLQAAASGFDRAVFSSTRPSPQTALAVALARMGRPVEAFAHAEAGLARALLDEWGSALAERADLLAQVERLDRRLLPLLASAKLTDEQKRLRQELTEQRRGLLKRLAGDLAARSGKRVWSVERIQKSLPADAALVLWIDAPTEAWGCVVRASGAPRLERLPGSGKDGAWGRADHELHQKAYAALSDPNAPAGETERLRRALLAQRVAPLQKHLKAGGKLPAVRQLFVVATGPFARVPVEALTDDYAVCYVPSASVLGRLLAAPHERKELSLLALGDPDFARAPGKGRPRLPTTRREVEALVRLVGKERSTVLLGKEASAHELGRLVASGKLSRYRWIHLATHAEVDWKRPDRTALVLAQGRGPGDGRLTVADVLRDWRLSADLVVLSANESGLGPDSGGEGLLGFPQAFLQAGARSLVVSRWKIDDEATALLMVRFYQNLLGKRAGLLAPLSKVEALAEARRWLRDLSAKEVKAIIERVPRGKAARAWPEFREGGGRPAGGLTQRRSRLTLPNLLLAPAEKPVPLRKEAKPFAHPYYWAAFVLIGDPR